MAISRKAIIRIPKRICRFFGSKPNYNVFALGEMPLRLGGELLNAKLAYKTYGKLNSSKSNAIVFPTCYSALASDNAWMVGEGRALDPSKYFIIITSTFGNGESSSPSNTEPPHDMSNFPLITVDDNVDAQRCLIDHFGITKIPLVLGRNLGAHISWLWKTRYPDLVGECVTFGRPIHRNVYDVSIFTNAESVLSNHPGFRDLEKSNESCLRAFARSFSKWGLSRAFYKHELFEKFGTTENGFQLMWENHFVKKHPHNLLAMLGTWRHAIIEAPLRSNEKHLQTPIRPMGPSFLTCPFGGGECNPSEVEKMPYSYFIPIPFQVWSPYHGGFANTRDRIDDDIKNLLKGKSSKLKATM